MAGRRESLYIAKSGHLAVMAELLSRGYNVAVPEVDVGDDILVVHDERGTTWRVQVKTATAQPLRSQPGEAVRFSIRLAQLETPKTPKLYYVLVIRRPNSHSEFRNPQSNRPAWEFLIISRRQLYREFSRYTVGSRYKSALTIRFSVRANRVTSEGRDFQAYRNNWTRYWPRLAHGSD